jgi:hypothetical protein
MIKPALTTFTSLITLHRGQWGWGTFSIKQRNSIEGNVHLTGKVAVVTGPGSGIGRAIAVKRVVHGSSIHVDKQAAGTTWRTVAAGAGDVSVHLCDVNNQAEVKAVLAKLFRCEGLISSSIRQG